MNPQPSLSAFSRDTFHPLELIPFFRRFPVSFGRNFLYTFIWSSLIGLGFYLMNAMGAGRLLSLNALGLYILIANVIGLALGTAEDGDALPVIWHA